MNPVRLPLLARLSGWLRARLNLWIALALLLANGLAWLRASAAPDLPEVAPRLDPQIAAIRQKMWSGQAGGQSFSILITDQMASEAIAWFLERHPQVPFSHPQVQIDPQGITGRGLIHVFGLSTPVYGRVTLRAVDGKPVVRILEVGVAGASAPGFVLQAVEAELAAQVQAAQNLPLILTRLELRQGGMLVEGVYR